MARFEEVLPALRAGKKVRRAAWPNSCYLVAFGQGLIDQRRMNAIDVSWLADDWEIVPEPKRVAIYFVPSSTYIKRGGVTHLAWIRETHEIGKQPDGAVLVPGSERTQENEQ